jgi:hypothetical protein
MKLSEVLPLFEMRKNPDLNLKISAYEHVMNIYNSLQNKKNLFISFTDIIKLGINPLSTWGDTPNAIYSYNVHDILSYYPIHKQRSFESLPYGQNYPFVHLFSWNGNGKFIELSQYSESNLSDDLTKIRKLLPNERFKLSLDEFDNLVDSNNEEPARKFFNIMKALVGLDYSMVMSKNLTTINKNKRLNQSKIIKRDVQPSPKIFSISSRNWNWLLRNLGYAGISDTDEIIYKNAKKPEPIQTLFTSTSVIHHIKTVDNVDYVQTLKHYEPLSINDKVLIKNGIYKNTSGKIINIKNDKATLEISEFGKLTNVEIPLYDLKQI